MVKTKKIIIFFNIMFLVFLTLEFSKREKLVIMWELGLWQVLGFFIISPLSSFRTATYISDWIFDTDYEFGIIFVL